MVFVVGVCVLFPVQSDLDVTFCKKELEIQATFKTRDELSMPTHPTFHSQSLKSGEKESRKGTGEVPRPKETLVWERGQFNMATHRPVTLPLRVRTL